MEKLSGKISPTRQNKYAVMVDFKLARQYAKSRADRARKDKIRQKIEDIRRT
jgi:hypothetical protein